MYVAVAMIAQLPASAGNDTINELQMVMDEANAVCKYRMNTTYSFRCYQDGYFALQPIVSGGRIGYFPDTTDCVAGCSARFTTSHLSPIVIILPEMHAYKNVKHTFISACCITTKPNFRG
jgi:hypothetical protein